MEMPQKVGGWGQGGTSDLTPNVAQASKPAVSQVSQPAELYVLLRSADLEVGDTAGLETCATSN
jgi:hypothetical protein